MIHRSGATIVPMHFTGQNSRTYQIANKLSATLRQSLLLHEIKRSLFKPQRPYIGQPIPAALLKDWEGNPRGFLAWLREHTLDLGQELIDLCPIRSTGQQGCPSPACVNSGNFSQPNGSTIPASILSGLPPPLPSSFSHSFAVYTGTEDQEPFQQATGEILGIYAALVFFLLSGILITDSALNTPSPWRFAIKRARRILPAFVASNLLVVLAICPFFAKDGAQDFLTDPQTWRTLLRVLTLQDAALRFNSVEFAHETGAGYPGLWNLANGVLWTIRIELMCYVLVGVMAAVEVAATDTRSGAFCAELHRLAEISPADSTLFRRP